jgi:hypothetical protein
MTTSLNRTAVTAITTGTRVKLFQGWQSALAILIGSTIALTVAHSGYYRLGDFEVTVLRDGSLSLPASIMTNTTEAETVKALARNFQKSPLMPRSMHSSSIPAPSWC